MKLPPLEILTPPATAAVEPPPADGSDAVLSALSAAGVGVEDVTAATAPQLVRYDVRLSPGVDPKKVERAIDAVSLAVSRPARYAGTRDGRVVIEASRTSADVVSLIDVIQRSEALVRLGIPLGIGTDGHPVVARLAEMPHMLVAGQTGGGKSEFLTSALVSLLLRNSPADLRMVLIDPKQVELSAFEDAPHVCEIITDPLNAAPALRRMVDLMDRRYQQYKAAGLRNISEYNDQAGAGEHHCRHVVVVDELADLMAGAVNSERFLVRLATLGRAAGIHLILATQHPEAKVLTGQLRLNIPARVAFAVQSHVASKVALDVTGAERLRGRGDGLFKAPSVGAPVRFQAPLVPPADVARLVEWWRRNADPAPQKSVDAAPIEAAPVDDGADLRAEIDDWIREESEAAGAPLLTVTPDEILGDAGFTPEVLEALGERLAPLIASRVAESLSKMIQSEPISPTEGVASP